VSSVAPAPLRCYLICTVQRTGSWLLCHALQDTGVAGVPAEYFHRGDEAFWATRWGVSSDADFFSAMLVQQTTPNGVFGSKMMWNYLNDALSRLRKVMDRPRASDAQILSCHLPQLKYLWLRRRDFVRQGVSWWRAAATGQYALTAEESPAALPEYDLEGIRNLVVLAEESDSAWQKWFITQGITPFEVSYEDMVEDLEASVAQVLAFLEVEPPASPLHTTPRLRRQADGYTEEVVRRFLSSQS
jgi:trehalose 2-sulfotransferase